MSYFESPPSSENADLNTSGLDCIIPIATYRYLRLKEERLEEPSTQA